MEKYKLKVLFGERSSDAYDNPEPEDEGLTPEQCAEKYEGFCEVYEFSTPEDVEEAKRLLNQANDGWMDLMWIEE